MDSNKETCAITKNVPLDFGIHDARIVRYMREANTLTLVLVTWNENPRTLRFKDVLVAHECQAVETPLEAFYEVLSSTLLDQGRADLLGLAYSSARANAVRHFAFRDVFGNVVLEVLCDEFEVQGEGAP